MFKYAFAVLATLSLIACTSSKSDSPAPEANGNAPSSQGASSTSSRRGGGRSTPSDFLARYSNLSMEDQIENRQDYFKAIEALVAEYSFLNRGLVSSSLTQLGGPQGRIFNQMDDIVSALESDGEHEFLEELKPLFSSPKKRDTFFKKLASRDPHYILSFLSTIIMLQDAIKDSAVGGPIDFENAAAFSANDPRFLDWAHQWALQDLDYRQQVQDLGKRDPELEFYPSSTPFTVTLFILYHIALGDALEDAKRTAEAQTQSAALAELPIYQATLSFTILDNIDHKNPDHHHLDPESLALLRYFMRLHPRKMNLYIKCFQWAQSHRDLIQEKAQSFAKEMVSKGPDFFDRYQEAYESQETDGEDSLRHTQALRKARR